MNLITRFKQTCAELNPDLDLALNECDDNAFLDPITEAHWQGYQMREGDFNKINNKIKRAEKHISELKKSIDLDVTLIMNLQSENHELKQKFITSSIPLTTKGGE